MVLLAFHLIISLYDPCVVLLFQVPVCIVSIGHNSMLAFYLIISPYNPCVVLLFQVPVRPTGQEGPGLRGTHVQRQHDGSPRFLPCSM